MRPASGGRCFRRWPLLSQAFCLSAGLCAAFFPSFRIDGLPDCGRHIHDYVRDGSPAPDGAALGLATGKWRHRYIARRHYHFGAPIVGRVGAWAYRRHRSVVRRLCIIIAGAFQSVVLKIAGFSVFISTEVFMLKYDVGVCEYCSDPREHRFFEQHAIPDFDMDRFYVDRIKGACAPKPSPAHDVATIGVMLSELNRNPLFFKQSHQDCAAVRVLFQSHGKRSQDWTTTERALRRSYSEVLEIVKRKSQEPFPSSNSEYLKKYLSFRTSITRSLSRKLAAKTAISLSCMPIIHLRLLGGNLGMRYRNLPD